MRSRLTAGVLVATLAAGAFAQATRVGNEFQVNTYATSSQYQLRAAASGAGDFVVVWVSEHDSDGLGIFGRRFTSSGVALALEFRVNTFTIHSQYNPTVAADDDGDFVVAWSNLGQAGSQLDVFARRFNSAGAPQATEFQVAIRTVDDQNYPAAATDAAGGFVIAWQDDRDGTVGIFARRFNSAGISQANEFQVNAYTPGSQSKPSVAMNGPGAFVVAWNDGRDGSAASVFARRFDASGAALGADFQINSYTSGFQNDPFLALDGDGGMVVAWTSDGGQDGSVNGVFAKRFDAGGGQQTREFLVNVFTAGSQSVRSVAIDGDGDFIVAWDSPFDGDDGVVARRFDAAGVAQATEFQVNTHTQNTQFNPSVAAGRAGNFVVAWNSYLQDGDEFGVFAQRFSVPKVFDIDANGAAEALTDGLLFLRFIFGFRGPTLVTGAVAGNCTRCIPAPVESYLGGLAGLTLVKPVGPEFQVNAYTPSNQFRPHVAVDSDGDFVVVWHSGHDGSSYGVLGRRYNSTGAPIAGEFLVNSNINGFQGYGVVGVDADGDFVVAWESRYQDGSNDGIFARRFNSAGTPLAVEFQVNSYTLYHQGEPAIAMNAAGSFVIAWQSYYQDYSYAGVFARRFNASGTPQAAEFMVNSYTFGYQGPPAVAMAASGSFVVVWTGGSSQDGSGDGVFGRRFDTAGVAQGVEFQINMRSVNYQEYPAVDMDGAGNFVVAWEGYNQDGSLDGIFVRRFTAAGQPQTGDVQANLFTSFSQYQPKVAIETGGEFVVTWSSYGQDGNAMGVFARRFNSAGTPQPIELQVSEYGTGYQYWPAIGMDDSGDFVVAWQSAGQDGSAFGAFARRFAATRAGDIDGNGVVGPLTDGLLLLRYLFGFRGATLITGAVGPGCTRCTALAIESFIAAKV